MTFDDKVIYEHCIFGSDITICFEPFLEALETLEGERSVIGHRYGGIPQRKADFIKAINQRGPISNQIQKPPVFHWETFPCCCLKKFRTWLSKWGHTCTRYAVTDISSPRAVTFLNGPLMDQPNKVRMAYGPSPTEFITFQVSLALRTLFPIGIPMPTLSMGLSIWLAGWCTCLLSSHWS